MTPTPEAVEAAALAILESHCASTLQELYEADEERDPDDPNFTDQSFDDWRDKQARMWSKLATAALTAALPLLRDQWLDELIAANEGMHPACLTPCSLDPDDDWQLPLSDWLRSQKGQTNDQ